MLGWLVSLSIFLVLAYPYQNIFSIPRINALLVLLILIIGRLSLNKCKYNRLVAVGNILILGTFVMFLFTFSNPKYFSMRYVFAIGQFLNFVALFFNGGRMPVKEIALARRGRQLLPDDPLHLVENQHSRMRILDDRIYTPVLSNKVISIGDVLTEIGIIITAVHLYLFN